MNTRIPLILAFTIAAVGCGKKEEPVKEEAVGSFYQPLTNDEIMAESKRCEDRGFNAEALVVKDFGARIVHIQCQPRSK